MDIETLYFKNSQEWRKWLEENHNSQQEVWLVHYKKKSNRTSISLNDAVQEELSFNFRTTDKPISGLHGLTLPGHSRYEVQSVVSCGKSRKAVRQGMPDAWLLEMVGDTGFEPVTPCV